MTDNRSHIEKLQRDAAYEARIRETALFNRLADAVGSPTTRLVDVITLISESQINADADLSAPGTHPIGGDYLIEISNGLGETLWGVVVRGQVFNTWADSQDEALLQLLWIRHNRLRPQDAMVAAQFAGRALGIS